MSTPDLNHASPAPVLAVQRSGLIASGDRVLVALSGGPDSTALLLALLEDGHHVVAAHYDHALQPGSGDVVAHVRGLCDRMGVELIVERRTSPMPRGSVQAGARTLRYEFLERARIRAGADVVAIGHTADDVVEGVVLHMLRGCGLAGLRGMPARRDVFVRPLLSVWRCEVANYLESRGVVPLLDPANSNPAYARVRVRHEILPALERDRPGITKHLHAAAARAAALQEAVAGMANSTLNGDVTTRSAVASAPQPVAAEVMRQLYARAGGAQPALSRAHLAAMLRLAQPGRGGRGVDLPGGLRLRIVGETMQVVSQPTANAHAHRLELSTCLGCDAAAAAHLKPALELRLGYRSPGLTMRPLGGRGTRKLQDIFVDARVPREERDAWPLVFAGEALAIVPGIAVSADLASRKGEPSLHVTVSGIPAKVETLNSIPGDPL